MQPVELTVKECLTRLRSGTVGRVAVTTREGLRIFPVNYTVHGDTAVVFRTSPYSELGAHAPDSEIAFEIDHIDHGWHEGWSVLAYGRAEAVDDEGALAEIRADADPQPWAGGTRNLYVMLSWRELTGRRIGHSPG